MNGLADECEELSRPGQTRLAAWTLLADGVFSARKRMQRNAAELFGGDLSVRLLAHALTSDPETPVPAKDRGAQEVIELLHKQLAAQPESPLVENRVAIVTRLQDRQSFDEWWQAMLRDAAGGPQQAAWLRIGTPVHAASRLDPGDIDKLDLSADDSLPCAVGAGVVPSPDSPLERRMIQAVLAGQCSDLQGAPHGTHAELLTILAPQHLLCKASSDNQAYKIAVGHLDAPVPQHQRQAAIKRLTAHDERFTQVQQALRFNRGQAGTTSPWGNTARALSAIYGPCWLAAEIAVIGAATSSSATTLLVAHHATALDRPSSLPQYSQQQLAEHSRYGQAHGRHCWHSRQG